MSRTPDEIYDEIQSVQLPSISPDKSIAEKLAWAEASVACFARIGSLWDEIRDAAFSDSSVPIWAYMAAGGASSHAAEEKWRAQGRVEAYSKLLESQRVRAGTT